MIGLLITTINSCKKEEDPIIKKDAVITWAKPADITSGTALSATQLNATANVTGTFVYTPASGTVLSVGAAQSLKVDFTPTDAVNYNTATKTVTINVTAPPSTVTDIDGNVYKTVTIGTQTWMAENLKTTKYNDGTNIPNVTDSVTWAGLSTPGYCWYENNIANKTTYGALYNWYAVNTAKLAPTGWHVSTYAEWTTLTNSVAGGKLKEIGTTHWDSPNTGATNETGFTALPGGIRYYDGQFDDVGSTGGWWGATEYATAHAFDWYMYYNSNLVYGIYNFKVFGLSVRCIKD